MSPLTIKKLTEEEQEEKGKEFPQPFQHLLFSHPSNAASHDIFLEAKKEKKGLQFLLKVFDSFT